MLLCACYYLQLRMEMIGGSISGQTSIYMSSPAHGLPNTVDNFWITYLKIKTVLKSSYQKNKNANTCSDYYYLNYNL